MTQVYPSTKQKLIREIIEYSDFYKDRNELENLDFWMVKSIHKSCLIPVLRSAASLKSLMV